MQRRHFLFSPALLLFSLLARSSTVSRNAQYAEKYFSSKLSPIDPLFGVIASFVVKQRWVSISLVQRRFKLGYNRARCIIEDLELVGVTLPPDKHHRRKVRRLGAPMIETICIETRQG